MEQGGGLGAGCMKREREREREKERERLMIYGSEGRDVCKIGIERA